MSRLVLAASVLAAALPVLAQQGRGSYFGTVTDTSGAAVPAAKVTLTNLATNTAVTTETNNDGLYTATALQIGEYSIQVEKSGFKRAIRSGLILQVDQRAQIDFRLDVGGVAETIEVKGEAPLVDTGSATVGASSNSRSTAATSPPSPSSSPAFSSASAWASTAPAASPSPVTASPSPPTVSAK